MTPWYQSKTVIFNAITTVIGVLALVAQSDLITLEVVKVVLIIVGALNVVLRVWFTDSAVTTPFGKHVKL